MNQGARPMGGMGMNPMMGNMGRSEAPTPKYGGYVPEAGVGFLIGDKAKQGGAPGGGKGGGIPPPPPPPPPPPEPAAPTRPAPPNSAEPRDSKNDAEFVVR